MIQPAHQPVPPRVPPQDLSLRAGRVARRGFTLIELIVVIVLMSVVAGLVAPRLLDLSRRRAQETARQVKNLLSIAAHRQSLGAGSQRLSFDRAAATLSLLTPRPVAEQGAAGQWGPDPLVPPVSLEGVALASASLDGSELDPAAWSIDFAGSQQRPTLRLVLEDRAAAAGRPASFVLILPAWSSEAVDDRGAARLAAPIDLDASGMGTSTW